MLNRNALTRSQNFLKSLTVQVTPLRSKLTIDKSKVPTIKEDDLEENFIKGSGPGGQKVNKSNNCVYLLHKPSGISVKVHELRDQAQNRKIAREKILTKLDNLINKESSIENQKEKILKEKLIKKAQKQKKLMEMKSNWKKIISELNKTE